jgi:AcrR family transcriptional regulator
MIKNEKFDKKKECIKTAGMKSFTAYGYSKTTLEDIANMLGMKKNSLYYYFESKDALVRELLEDEIKVHINNLNNIISSKLPADKTILKVIKYQSEYIREFTQKYTIKLSAFIELNKVIKHEFSDLEKNERKALESILRKGVIEGIFIEHDSKILAQDIESLVHAVFRSHFTDSKAEFVNDVDFDLIFSMIERLIKYIVNGIKVK